MSFLKLNDSACVTLVALAMLVASSKIALADTTNLICQMNDNKFSTALIRAVAGQKIARS